MWNNFTHVSFLRHFAKANIVCFGTQFSQENIKTRKTSSKVLVFAFNFHLLLLSVYYYDYYYYYYDYMDNYDKQQTNNFCLYILNAVYEEKTAKCAFFRISCVCFFYIFLLQPIHTIQVHKTYLILSSCD